MLPELTTALQRQPSKAEKNPPRDHKISLDIRLSSGPKCLPRPATVHFLVPSTAILLFHAENRARNTKLTDLLRLIRARSVECSILIQPHRIATTALQRIAVVEFIDPEGGTAGILAFEGDQGGVLRVSLDVTNVPGTGLVAEVLKAVGPADG